MWTICSVAGSRRSRLRPRGRRIAPSRLEGAHEEGRLLDLDLAPEAAQLDHVARPRRAGSARPDRRPRAAGVENRLPFVAPAAVPVENETEGSQGRTAPRPRPASILVLRRGSPRPRRIRRILPCGRRPPGRSGSRARRARRSSVFSPVDPLLVPLHAVVLRWVRGSFTLPTWSVGGPELLPDREPRSMRLTGRTRRRSC